MNKEELVALGEEIRIHTRLPVATGELVEEIVADPDGAFEVRSTAGRRRAANVLLALGRRGSPRKLEVPGEDLPKVCYRLLEPEPFRGQHVLVVGGGNSAVECAVALADSGLCASVAISYRRSAFARCRGDNRRRIDEAIRTGKVQAHLPSEVRRISADEVHLDAGGQVLALAVIVQIGGTAPTELLARSGIEMITKYGEG
jgi:thioredoxin reductase